MSDRPEKTAVLLLNHFVDRALVDLYGQLGADCADTRDVFLLSDRTRASVSTARLPRGSREFTFTTRDLTNLGYPGKGGSIGSREGLRNMTLGNADLPVLLFFKHHPDYSRIWVVEYDVRYSGNWESLFAEFDGNDADLLGTTLQRRDQCPKWSHWHSLDLPTVDTDPGNWVRGFFPIYRMSARALVALDRAYKAGCRGHMEALLPTVLVSQGHRIEDIGGLGEFVQPGNENRFYQNQPATNRLSPGTFVYRPVLECVGDQPNTLWHPVKTPRPRWRNGLKRLLSTAATIVRDQLRDTRRRS
ncbi:MAG: hypothetical protein RIC56_01470 [Pseudomonadales bacterium]